VDVPSLVCRGKSADYQMNDDTNPLKFAFMVDKANPENYAPHILTFYRKTSSPVEVSLKIMGDGKTIFSSTSISLTALEQPNSLAEVAALDNSDGQWEDIDVLVDKTIRNLPDDSPDGIRKLPDDSPDASDEHIPGNALPDIARRVGMGSRSRPSYFSFPSRTHSPTPPYYRPTPSYYSPRRTYYSPFRSPSHYYRTRTHYDSSRSRVTYIPSARSRTRFAGIWPAPMRRRTPVQATLGRRRWPMSFSTPERRRAGNFGWDGSRSWNPSQYQAGTYGFGTMPYNFAQQTHYGYSGYHGYKKSGLSAGTKVFIAGGTGFAVGIGAITTT